MIYTLIDKIVTYLLWLVWYTIQEYEKKERFYV